MAPRLAEPLQHIQKLTSSAVDRRLAAPNNTSGGSTPRSIKFNAKSRSSQAPAFCVYSN